MNQERRSGAPAAPARVTRRIDRLRAMAGAVEHAMEANVLSIPLTPQERFEIFGDFVPEDHDEEARRRWGHGEARRQSRDRAAAMTGADWARFTEDASAAGLTVYIRDAIHANADRAERPA